MLSDIGPPLAWGAGFTGGAAAAEAARATEAAEAVEAATTEATGVAAAVVGGCVGPGGGLAAMAKKD